MFHLHLNVNTRPPLVGDEKKVYEYTVAFLQRIYGHRQPTSSPFNVTYRRKSLGFGPEHLHAVFYASPYQIQTNGFTPMDPSMDPLDVARIFVEDVLSTQLSSTLSYKIHKDSYTDKSSMFMFVNWSTVLRSLMEI
jgi:hypothetical protein